MPKFLVDISGQIPIEADSKEEAEKKARDHRNVGCYCGFNPREIGKDCDDLGWPLTFASHAEKRRFDHLKGK